MFKNFTNRVIVFLIVLFICFSCKKESDQPPTPEKLLLKGWHFSYTHQLWLEESQQYAKGNLLNVINFRNDSCLVVVDGEFKLISDTSQKWTVHYDLKAPIQKIGQFTKFGDYTPGGYPDYLWLPEDIWVIDSIRGDTLYFLPTITWTQISGTIGEVKGSSFYSKESDSWHRVHQFTNDSLIACLYKQYSAEIPTGNWSEVRQFPVIFSENSYQLQLIDSPPTSYIFHNNLWITSFNDPGARYLVLPYIKK